MTGAAVWDGAITLARYLDVHGHELGLNPDSKCVELGSGTGLLGIALNVCLGVRDVCVTDKVVCVLCDCVDVSVCVCVCACVCACGRE